MDMNTAWLIILGSIGCLFVYSTIDTGLIYNLWVQLSITILLANLILDGIPEIRRTISINPEN